MLAVVVALVATACGKSSTSSTTTTTSAKAAATGTPIKVGTTIWPQANISLNLRMPGIKAAIMAINADGGINNHPIQLVYCEANDANEGETCARKMVSEGVLATVSDANYLAEQPNIDILTAANIPLIDPFINSPGAYSAPGVFLISGGTPVEYAATVADASVQKITSLAFLAGVFSAAQNSVDLITKAANFYKIDVKGRVDIPLGAADYTPYVSAAADLKAGYYPAIIAPFMTDLFLQASNQIGETLKIGLSQGQFSSTQVTMYAKGLEGSLLVGAVPPREAAADFPELQRCIDEIQAYYDATKDPLAAPETVTSLSTRSWLSVQAFAQVARALPDSNLNAAAVLNGFNTVQNMDLGIIKPWTPSARGPAPYANVSNSWQYLATVKSGKMALIQKDPIDALAFLK